MSIKINPVGLKGQEITERMKQLMGVTSINENKKASAVELTKVGPDGNVYAIIRENHEYYIKTANKKENLKIEDFQYIGGLQNKKQEAYPTYAKAIKQLNLKFNSLNEVYGKSGQVNVFKDDNLLTEGFYDAGVAEYDKPAMASFQKQYGDEKGKNIYYATANKQDRDPETFEKMEAEEYLEEYSTEEGLTAEMEAIEAMMYEKELSDKQKDIAKLAGNPDEIDADDLAALRAGEKTDEGYMDEIEMSEYEMAIDEMIEESKEELTDKEKKFAALAEPKDKITFADKIAGAKKGDEKSDEEGKNESIVDEMEALLEASNSLLKKKH